MQKVLVFGTFDSIHDGHRAMLREAKNLAPKMSYLVVAIAPDAVVQALKGSVPRHAASERIALLRQERIADEVTLGDDAVDSWRIIQKIKPAIIALGYDQQELRASLEAFLEAKYPDVETEAGEWQTNPKKPRIVMLSPHKPETHHNRIIHS